MDRRNEPDPDPEEKKKKKKKKERRPVDPSAGLRGRNRRISLKYVPQSLTESDKRLQIQSIKRQERRPKVDSFQSKRSPLVKSFEDKYGYKINQLDKIDKQIIKRAGIDKILSKGKGAYYSSGSRPNQTADSWALARLAGVIMGSPARKVDQKIWDEYKR
jgi:hypothetical protein